MLFDAMLAMSLAAGPGPVDLTTVTSRLDQPTSVVSAPNGTMFVTEKAGRIVKVKPGGKTRTWFRVKDVTTTGERGLLSMVRLDGKRFYAAYTDRRGALQVSRFTKGGGERRIIRIPHPEYDNHNGGQIQLHEGLLYISTGDGGGSGDPFRAAGRTSDLRGKILRIDPTCGKRYCIPASNPRRSPVIAKGLRNPWRFSIDTPTRTLWIGDVGQNAFEEIDRMPLSGPLVDFGWSCWEARSRYNRDDCNGRKVTKPLITYSHASGDGESVTGGYVYRGSAIPALQGWYVFGDFISGDVWAWRDGTRERIASAQGLTSFGLTAEDELLLTTIDGRLLRMTP
jgi:glucose/arabinose dehydrogenase